MVLYITGIGKAGAIAVSFLASLAISLAYALLPRMSVLLGMGPNPGRIAGVIGALAPVNFWAQTNGVFDSSYTALLLVLGLILLLSSTFSAKQGALFGSVLGLAFLANSASLPALAAAAAILVWVRKSSLRQALHYSCIAGLMFVLVISPWVLRNRIVFGHWVLSRTNFGLELWLSNSDTATGDLELNVRSEHFGKQHPMSSKAEFVKVQQMGEIAYNAEKYQIARDWIASHKERFRELVAERVLLFWVPRMNRNWQTVFEGLVSLMGLWGIVSAVRRKELMHLVPAAVVLAYPVVYYLIQSSPRYRFPIEPVLLLMGAIPIWRLIPASMKPLQG